MAVLVGHVHNNCLSMLLQRPHGRNLGRSCRTLQRNLEVIRKVTAYVN